MASVEVHVDRLATCVEDLVLDTTHWQAIAASSHRYLLVRLVLFAPCASSCAPSRSTHPSWRTWRSRPRAVEAKCCFSFSDLRPLARLLMALAAMPVATCWLQELAAALLHMVMT